MHVCSYILIQLIIQIPIPITEKKYFMVTFIGSILWIAAYSYLMVWWATTAGDTIGIPPPVSLFINNPALL